MAKVHFLCFSLLRLFSLLSADYSPPNKFFINSGSSSNVTLNNRNFIGDIKSYSFFSITRSNSVSNTNNSSELYQTARFYNSPFAYKFQIDQNGTYFLRLHFYPFSSSTNLFSALFNVSTSKSLLLSSFNGSTSANLPIIKDFLLKINVGEFQIQFTPSGNSSLAFVNAIEVFVAPDDFVQDEVPTVSSSGANKTFQGLQSHVLQTVYKINVGGETVTPDNDTLWRTWIPDDEFLYNRNAARSYYSGNSPNYQYGNSSVYIAPAFVYETVQEMNINSSRQTNNFNITWIFNVSKSSEHYVRFHFCDVVSPSLNVLQFNLFIYSGFSQEIDPYAVVPSLAVPFYYDFLVVSDGSGFIYISVGPRSDSMNKSAFLNGVEIWELVTGSGSTIVESGSRKSPLIFVICSVVGGSFVILIIAVVALRWRKRKAEPVATLEWPLVSLYRGSSHSDRSAGMFNIPNINLGLKIPFADILAATNNFNPKLLIGEGGFGKVYKGKYQNMDVAVKRSQPGYNQGLTEFQAEIMVLSKIRHRHLVSLIGYCDDRYEMILVYEFMEKGTLKHHLYPAKGKAETSLTRIQLLAEWGISHQKQGRIGEIVDPLLAGKIASSSLRAFGETVEKCLRETGAERPSMDVVRWDLEYALKLQQTSTQREANEDSTTDFSLNLPLPVVQRLPSQSITDGWCKIVSAHLRYCFHHTSCISVFICFVFEVALESWAIISLLQQLWYTSQSSDLVFHTTSQFGRLPLCSSFHPISHFWQRRNFRLLLSSSSHLSWQPNDKPSKLNSRNPMAKVHFLCFSLLRLFSLLSADYSPPNKFFINSGSSSNVTLNNRNFIGDIKSYSFFSITRSNYVSNTNNSSELYQTARFYNSPFAYKFQIDQNGTYFLRLHFYPFSSSTNLFPALFNVSTSKSLLLSSFNGSTSANLPIIKDFLLKINVGEFQIQFTPSGNSSLAFVNAIEVFVAPDDFVQDEVPSVSSSGANKTFQGLQSHVLQTVYKINVGGEKVTPDNDTLWRTWIPDDEFLYNRNAARSYYSGNSPNYQYGNSSVYIAPAFVYETVQEMNINSSRQTNNFNITWIFNVSKSSEHYVRFHFCDVVSPSLNVLQFNLFIYSGFSQEIDPYAVVPSLAVPFYYDFLVVSDGSGFMNISVGPRSDSMNKSAFLNGVEIWELVTGSGSTIVESGSRKSPLIFVICSVVGGSFVILIIAVVALRWRKRKAEPVATLEWPWVPLYRGSPHSDRSAGMSNIPNINLGLKIPFADILAATNNFNPKLLIGEGGFGKVYKGKYQNMDVAVKRSQPGYNQGLTEFQAEIMVLSKIRHRHLVSLIGYCDDRYEMILVYEFMEKGTLKHHLYPPKGKAETSLTRIQLLAEWGISHQKQGRIGEIVDPLLAGKIASSSLRAFGETVEKCLRETGAERPSMDVVRWDLEYALKLQQTSTQREANEDSTTDFSLNLPLPVVQRLPSQSITGMEDNSLSRIEDFSEINASAVFSQLKMGGAR
ncbi:Serine-threonine/tyrosine-protein kinase, catalytic domain [Dillenia turbinata]|uniref:Serine-threonine/tyrosine-protein kinase, catalytic domain n=1 Tax=Dillenia turbinata TaxID=194707 RepID=A0AAN8UW40_9MAGN